MMQNISAACLSQADHTADAPLHLAGLSPAGCRGLSLTASFYFSQKQVLLLGESKWSLQATELVQHALACLLVN